MQHRKVPSSASFLVLHTAQTSFEFSQEALSCWNHQNLFKVCDDSLIVRRVVFSVEKRDTRILSGKPTCTKRSGGTKPKASIAEQRYILDAGVTFKCDVRDRNSIIYIHWSSKREQEKVYWLEFVWGHEKAYSMKVCYFPLPWCPVQGRTMTGHQGQINRLGED